MIYLTRVEKFNAAHKLYVAAWTEEKNKAVFGKCANANWHGHNYQLHVTVKGEPDPLTGMIIDAKELGRIVKERVTDILDHANLNLDVPFITADMQPTTEVLVKAIWGQLVDHVQPAQLYKIVLWETDTIYATYKGQ